MLLPIWRFPNCQNSLQYASSLLLRHLSEWWSGVFVAEFSSHCKVSSFSSTKRLPRWLNSSVSHDHCRTPFSVEQIFAPVEDIENEFVLVKWPGQLMITGQLILKDLRLKILVAWEPSDIFETLALIFSLKGQSHFTCIYY